MPINNQIIGGNWTDAQGNPIANGTIVFQLSQDEQSPSGQIGSGRKISIALDSTGNVPVSPATYIFANDSLNPINSYYTVWVYNSSGQLVWGPEQQQVLSSPSPFNLSAWVPSSINTGSTPVPSPALEVNGTPNVNQKLLNLINGDNITVTDNGNGGVNISSLPFPLVDQNGNSITSGEVLIVGTPPTVAASEGGQKANVTWSNSVLPSATAQTLVYKVQPFAGPGPVTGLTFTGANAGESVFFGTQGFNGVSNTEFGSVFFSTSSTPNTSVAGLCLSKPGITPNFGRPFTKFTQFYGRAALSATTNIRAWIGMAQLVFFGASLNSYNSDTAGSAGFVGFRFSDGTDTNWQAFVKDQTSGLSTIVDTGIVPDTNFHSFVVNYNGSTLLFYIDGTKVATISTNVPSGANASLAAACLVDNKNTANDQKFTFETLQETYLQP